MSDIAIRVENLSKLYRIGVAQKRHDTLRDAISDFGSHIADWVPFNGKSKTLAPHASAGVGNGKSDNTIWALKDVSFEVRRGEVVGIIGRNGAGKSTLLKILSRITEPTKGRAIIDGRVGSLLEVGTGFHPELTGRENIYLNGAILGMKRAEIDRKFDEIVAFAEVEKFLDTPVKHYSSGMYVRLAFAVAAHLEPEILLVDEVLSVGDAAFQKKCLGKMGDVAGEGRTVLFVSHNMGAITEICPCCTQISEGRIVARGSSREVISSYLSHDSCRGNVNLRDWKLGRTGEGPARLAYIETQDDSGTIRSQFAYGEPLVFVIGINAEAGMVCTMGISVRDPLGHVVLHFMSTDSLPELVLPARESGVRVRVPNNLLNDGYYYVSVYLADRFRHLNDRIGNCLSFKVDSTSQGSIGSLGSVRLPSEWTVNIANSSFVASLECRDGEHKSFGLLTVGTQ